jgi:peptidoglycan hydrolase CwlO-like protein
MFKLMSKSTDTAIKELMMSIDSKLDILSKEVLSTNHKIDLLTQDVSNVKTDISNVKTELGKFDNRLWLFGGIILTACLGTLLRAVNFQ